MPQDPKSKPAPKLSTGGPSGLSTSLQPGGTVPGGGPAASQGGLGTGGGQTAGKASGAVKRGGR